MQSNGIARVDLNSDTTYIHNYIDFMLRTKKTEAVDLYDMVKGLSNQDLY